MKEDSSIKAKEIKEELKILLTIIIAILVILKIAFYKESIFNVIKFGLSLIYFSLLPGYFILFNFKEHMSRNIRLIMAFPVGFAIYSILAYYLNIFIHLNYIIFLFFIISTKVLTPNSSAISGMDLFVFLTALAVVFDFTFNALIF